MRISSVALVSVVSLVSLTSCFARPGSDAGEDKGKPTATASGNDAGAGGDAATTTATTTATGTGTGGAGGGEVDVGCYTSKISLACDTPDAFDCGGAVRCCGGVWVDAKNVPACPGGDAGTGGGSADGAPPEQGTLAVRVYLLDQSSSHAFEVRLLDDWDHPVKGEGSSAEFDIKVEVGATIEFVGKTDPGTQNEKNWCQGASSAIVTAFWTKSIPVQIVQTAGACAIRVVAAAQECTGDTDCDGDPDATDCKPQDALVANGRPESKGDNIDVNCDGNVDPPKWAYTATGFPKDAPVELEDMDTWDIFPMAYVPNNNNWVAALTKGFGAPLRFRARLLGWDEEHVGWDGKYGYSTFPEADASCSQTNLLTVKVGNKPVDKSGNATPPTDPSVDCAQVITP